VRRLSRVLRHFLGRLLLHWAARLLLPGGRAGTRIMRFAAPPPAASVRLADRPHATPHRPRADPILRAAKPSASPPARTPPPQASRRRRLSDWVAAARAHVRTLIPVPPMLRPGAPRDPRSFAEAVEPQPKRTKPAADEHPAPATAPVRPQAEASAPDAMRVRPLSREPEVDRGAARPHGAQVPQPSRSKAGPRVRDRDRAVSIRELPVPEHPPRISARRRKHTQPPENAVLRDRSRADLSGSVATTEPERPPDSDRPADQPPPPSAPRTEPTPQLSRRDAFGRGSAFEAVAAIARQGAWVRASSEPPPVRDAARSPDPQWPRLPDEADLPAGASRWPALPDGGEQRPEPSAVRRRSERTQFLKSEQRGDSWNA
jgi:hypothetical protein